VSGTGRGRRPTRSPTKAPETPRSRPAGDLEQFERALELGHGDEEMAAVYYASAPE
jgi:hypothetical protein